MRAFRLLVLATAAAGGVLLSPAPAAAHGMNARVEVRADSVHLLAYFDDDSPADFAAVTVTDAAGHEVLTGKTDERGVWTCPCPAPGRYTLVAECIGHAAKVPFEVQADAGPAAFSNPRTRKAVGLAIGLTLLLGIASGSWLIRRRRGYNKARPS